MLLLAGLAPGLAGCEVLAIGGATAGGVAIAQERSVGAAIDDTTIKLALNGKLLQYEKPGVFQGVEIEVVEGRVLLAGSVPTPEDRLAVMRMAWETEGVTGVINELNVGDTTGVADFARDAWITAQLRSRLLFDKDIRSINYTVETVDGVVYLMGISDTPSEERRVTYHASRIDGVKKVVSYVVDKNDPSRRPAA